MNTQRVTKNLGINRSKDKPLIYDYIEQVLTIKKKKCSRNGNNKFNLKHKGNPLIDIKNFHIFNVEIDNGNVIIHSKYGLQSACKNCDKEYRKARLNASAKKFKNKTDIEVYDYFKKNYGVLCKCSMCNEIKKPECFALSKHMERGLHNTCKKCSKSYAEATGNRWAIYSPDGHYPIKLTPNDKCEICKSKDKLHKDHIFPLSKGGTDNKENIQILCRTHNLSKSATIDINNIENINPLMICDRYKHLLVESKLNQLSLNDFELLISKAVKIFLDWKYVLSYDALNCFFESEKTKNNRRHSTSHSIKAFKKYYERINV